MRLLASLLVAMTTLFPIADPPGLEVRGNATQPVFSLAEAIHESLFVEVAGVDSDADGRADRVAVSVRRPRETRLGLKVATIMTISPYSGGGAPVTMHAVDLDARGEPEGRGQADEGSPGTEPDSYYDDYFLPRGYATVDVRALGTSTSTGCPTVGDAVEAAGAKAVIDWLNGRARAFTRDGRPAEATWSTGKVGMIGVSWDGSIPNNVATTGVEGLETIVPIAGISSWYSYYRANGAVVAPQGYQGEDADVAGRFILTRPDPPKACERILSDMARAQDRETGDYNAFWRARDYVRQADGVRASVFVVQGLNDWNVRPDQATRWWQALRSPKKMWLHQGAHLDPMTLRTSEWLRQLHAWFDRWLYDLDTGIETEPAVDVETAPGQWHTSSAWPPPGTQQTRAVLEGPARATYTDQRSRTAEQLVARNPHAALWQSAELAEDFRLAGTPKVTLGAVRPSPYLTALLVDVGKDTRATGSQEPTGENHCFPGGGCYDLFRLETKSSPWKIVSRGWLDTRDQKGTYTWELTPQDHLFKKGHRIALVITSTDRDYTLRHPPGAVVEVSKPTLVLPGSAS
ncbi:Xaa-Pro dipeptidyl-peptidase [Nonomuraea soli]|uniref:X-Pro dipeptidyl-peptidase n=1 Tax=Nonomuraea soli TaxID=1032476 RepID=A0A7W0CJM9_9ACTN|nr:Xaa-Pro dipeptidyl-peptidase [Nonomuraea soli]MBA2892429.1 X-Pro dipeptidyl-peptidase [Nonomuraea soli]